MWFSLIFITYFVIFSTILNFSFSTPFFCSIFYLVENRSIELLW